MKIVIVFLITLFISGYCSADPSPVHFKKLDIQKKIELYKATDSAINFKTVMLQQNWTGKITMLVDTNYQNHPELLQFHSQDLWDFCYYFIKDSTTYCNNLYVRYNMVNGKLIEFNATIEEAPKELPEAERLRIFATAFSSLANPDIVTVPNTVVMYIATDSYPYGGKETLPANYARLIVALLLPELKGTFDKIRLKYYNAAEEIVKELNYNIKDPLFKDLIN